MAIKLSSCVVLLWISFATATEEKLMEKGDEPVVKADEKALLSHKIDSINILLYIFLLTITVIVIWLFKHRRFRFIHETGLAIIFGLIVGAIVHFAVPVGPPKEQLSVNISMFPNNSTSPLDIVKVNVFKDNKAYAYSFKGEWTQFNELDRKATFDPEIFFNIILPPIIFHAGYSLKRRHFFRNFGTILTFALIGTTVSSFVVGGTMYGLCQLRSTISFSFNECLFFGAIISATDPVTVLAIFHDLHVDVNVYALVFGESVLNDAVAIVLASAIQNYNETNTEKGSFEAAAFFRSLGNFLAIFFGSFFLGSITGCITAIITKFTKLREFPLLETALFFLMSYSTFLMAEAATLSGIVAVLFCGICQAHYTYNNLSEESRARTKQLFELLNFLAENFIFSYIGVSMFTFEKHKWDAAFIAAAFCSIALGRACNIYPLSFLLNLGRKHKISYNTQHMLFFAGLRGAMAFALAIRNTVGIARQIMLTTTSLIAIVTVIVCGGSTTQMLSWLRIPVGVEDDPDPHHFHSEPTDTHQTKVYEKAWLAMKWYNFDRCFMKPFLTHSRPTLLDTLPNCCMPLARLLTSSQQLTQPENGIPNDDSDADLIIDGNEVTFSSTQDLNGPTTRNRSLGDTISPDREHIPLRTVTRLPIYAVTDQTSSLAAGDLGTGSALQTRVRLPGPTGDNV